MAAEPQATVASRAAPLPLEPIEDQVAPNQRSLPLSDTTSSAWPSFRRSGRLCVRPQA